MHTIVKLSKAKADEETAWIFYQVMVKENYEDWEDLLENFPCETLAEINRLWLENSNNKLGISIQKEIYQSLGGTKEFNEEVWEKFCDRVGWRKEARYLAYNDIMPSCDITTDMTHADGGTSASLLPASLPALIYTRFPSLGWDFGGRVAWVAARYLFFSSLAQRLVKSSI